MWVGVTNDKLHHNSRDTLLNKNVFLFSCVYLTLLAAMDSILNDMVANVTYFESYEMVKTDHGDPI